MLFGLLGHPEQNPGSGAKGVFADVPGLALPQFYVHSPSETTHLRQSRESIAKTQLPSQTSMLR